MVKPWATLILLQVSDNKNSQVEASIHASSTYRLLWAPLEGLHLLDFTDK